VLTKLQLRWYWPYMEHEIRRRVRQCKTCQANKHGHPPVKAGWWKQNVEGPWQVEAVNLVGGLCMAPRGDVVGRERPLQAWEVRPPAPRPPPPLLESSTSSVVQPPPPEEEAPSGDTKKITPSEQHTRQTSVHRKDLVRDGIICGRYKDSTGHRTGKWANIHGSYEHHANISFCLDGITNEIHTPETKGPSHFAQPRCSFFPYADAATSRRT